MARWIRVSTIAYRPVEWGDNFMERQRARMAEMAELAATAIPKPDLVVFPEFCNVLGMPGLERQIEAAEPVPGPTVERLAEVARRHAMYIVVALPERAGDKLYNSAVFIGRDGDVVGIYHKYQPTIYEMEAGIIPGEDVPAFELDFGKVGAAICFDMKFVEVGQTMARNGARMCVFCSMFAAGQRLWHWARDFGMYVVSSCPHTSWIVDMGGGRDLAFTGSSIDEVAAGHVPPIATALINMDRCQFHLDYNNTKLADIFAKYGQRVEIQIYRPEAHFTLASLMDDVTVDDIVEEFQLEPWNKYLDRARGVREETMRQTGAP
ncbi:MAG: carbon-nitrogen hydrolase family protein [Armatimonadetes bacterium]|nr:carbon-nitrogen hydrolase family protein [Armatimonadota bacterium]